MSMHNIPLTPLEKEGLEKHRLPVGTPSQLSDAFRHGIAWALRDAVPAVPTDEQIHAAYRKALGQSIRERDMPEIRKFARALLQSAPQPSCWCRQCNPNLQMMILCPICGNKRCPHANDHRNPCTGSNEPGQVGSDYPMGAAK